MVDAIANIRCLRRGRDRRLFGNRARTAENRDLGYLGPRLHYRGQLHWNADAGIEAPRPCKGWCRGDKRGANQ